MADKRRADFTMLLRKQSKKKANKIELFKWNQFLEPRSTVVRYRVRVNGKWWPAGERKFLTLTHVKEIVFRTIRNNI